MLHRCCIATLLLLLIRFTQCFNVTHNYSRQSVFEFHSDEDGERNTTRVASKLFFDKGLIYVGGFTSHTVNTQGTLISRVNATFANPIFVGYETRDADEMQRRIPAELLTWAGKSPFVEDFWLGTELHVRHLSVHVYGMSLNPVYVSYLRGNSLTDLELTGNHWATITGLTLVLRNLKKLSLSDNQIEVLHQGLLHGCPYLEVLNLSGNKIKNIWVTFTHIRPVRTTLQELNLARNTITEFKELNLWRYFVNLKKLNVSYNQISSVVLYDIPKNSEVDLSYNNITEFEKRSSFRVDRVVFAGQNISSLSEVGTILSSTDHKLFENSFSQVELAYDNLNSNYAMYVPRSECKIKNMFIACEQNGYYISHRQYSRLVILSGNPLKIDGSLILEICPVNHVDLSQNHLMVLNEDIPWHISETKQLNLSWNSIGYISRNIFQNMTRLTVLDLSYNHLKHVQLILYSSLFMLDISNNYLNRMNISHYSSNCTTIYLNLSHNSFTNILEVEWSQFEQFSKVDLGQNNLQCCGPEWHYSRAMLLRYHDKVLNIYSTKPLSCVMPNNGMAEMTNMWLTEDHCQNHLQGWVAFGCLLFLTPLLIHAVELLDYYTHQTERDLAHHLTRLKKQGLEQDESHALECQYDAFVCHSHRDARWVRQELVANLENDRGYCLCIHYRDFQLGSLIEENIETAMNTSRKVIVVVTRAFLQSYWCKMELTFAWTKMVNEGRNYIIVIELERIPKEKRPPVLCYLMQSRTYLEWPEEPTDVVKQGCWRRVQDALGKSLRDRQQKQKNCPEVFQIDC